MKKILLAIMMAVIMFGCSCNAKTIAVKKNGWGGADPEALYVQGLMKGTVQVDIKFVVSTAALVEMGVIDDMFVEEEATGSGVVIASHHGHSLVLTALHVCDQGPFLDLSEVSKLLPKLPITSQTLKIVTVDGREYPASVYAEDKDHDTCLIDVVGNAGTVIPVAYDMPPLGATVLHIGAPAGIWGENLVWSSFGQYVGIKAADPESEEDRDPQMAWYSVAIAPGSSGGPVFYHGEVIGIMTKVLRRFDHGSFGPYVDSIRPFLGDWMPRWLTLN